MIKGTIVAGKTVIGSFEVSDWPREELITKFRDGLRLHHIFQLAEKHGELPRFTFIPNPS